MADTKDNHHCDYALIKKGCTKGPKFFKFNEICRGLKIELTSKGVKDGLWACSDWIPNPKKCHSEGLWWLDLPPTDWKGYDNALIHPSCNNPNKPIYNTGSWKNSDPMWCCNNRFEVDNTGQMGGSTYYKCKDNQSYTEDRCYPYK